MSDDRNGTGGSKPPSFITRMSYVVEVRISAFSDDDDSWAPMLHEAILERVQTLDLPSSCQIEVSEPQLRSTVSASPAWWSQHSPWSQYSPPRGVFVPYLELEQVQYRAKGSER